MNKEKISVIVPVYNTGKYLKECIDSILNQTHKNLEIILVDDGSSDGSGAICDGYAEKDDRVKVIHKENGGVSSARNAGLDIASGKYVGFIDGDDVIDEDMYEFLLDNLLLFDADISRCGMVRETGEKKEAWGNDNSVPVIRSTIEGICDVGEANGILPVSPCNKLYKYDIIENIRFDTRFVYAEDTLFNYYAACNAKKTVCCDKIKYHYISNSDSASHKKFCAERFDEHHVTDIIMQEQRDNNITYPYCLKGDIMKSFRTIKEMIISNNEMEYFDAFRKRILNNKRNIFTQKIYTRTTKLKTSLLLMSPWIYKKYIKMTRGNKNATKNHCNSAGI